jgi:hypothetical protein
MTVVTLYTTYFNIKIRNLLHKIVFMLCIIMKTDVIYDVIIVSVFWSL